MPRKIEKSVGNGGFNQLNDVRTVQDLLNLVPTAQGGPTKMLNVDGLCYGLTLEAIRRFQRLTVKMAVPDGRVDPGGGSLKKLHEFETQFGSTRFRISRLELKVLTKPRTVDTPDRFYELAAVGSTRRLVYFFSGPGERLAETNAIMTRLQGRAGESTEFTTQLPHSLGAFQVNGALHSERSDDVNNSRAGLSLVIPDDLLNIIVPHRWITPTTQPGVRRDFRGDFRPVGEFTGLTS